MNYVSVEKMKYKKQTLPYSLVLFGLVINVVYFMVFYKNNDNFFYTYKMGISVIYNLLFMLAVFLSAENIKNYHTRYAFVLLIIGILQFVRIFVYPLQALDAGRIENSNYVIIVILLSISGSFIIIGALIGGIKSYILRQFVKGKLKIKNIE